VEGEVLGRWWLSDVHIRGEEKDKWSANEMGKWGECVYVPAPIYKQEGVKARRAGKGGQAGNLTNTIIDYAH
jgi:hypothetical protein